MRYLIPIAFAVLAILIAIIFPGTGDSGDSVMHYLIAHHAFYHPELFLDHWGKPVFTFFSAPFAYFGFTGIKIFNILCAIGSLIYVQRITAYFDGTYAWCSPIFLLLSPGYFILVLSGLTEPFFAFLLVLSAYLLLKERWIWTASILSFLTFVRPEGLFFIGIFGFYFILNRKYHHLPWFLLGHIVLALIAWPYYGDPLWIFTQMTNAVSGVYYYPGSNAFHYLNQLFYIIGPVIYLLFAIGLISIIAAIRKIWPKPFGYQQLIIAGSVIAFILAHSIFWYFGIFKSMGLTRVLVCVLPLIAILAGIGFQRLMRSLNAYSNWQKMLGILLIGLAIFFPFSGNKGGIQWFESFDYTADQKLILQMKEELEFQNVRAYSHPSIPYLFDIDPFEKGIWRSVDSQAINAIEAGSIIIWDNWYSVVEQKTSEEDLLKLGLVKRSTYTSGKYSFTVFEKEM